MIMKSYKSWKSYNKKASFKNKLFFVFNQIMQTLTRVRFQLEIANIDIQQFLHMLETGRHLPDCQKTCFSSSKASLFLLPTFHYSSLHVTHA